MLKVTETTLEDVAEFIPLMKDEDRTEYSLTQGETPEDSMMNFMRAHLSDTSWNVLTARAQNGTLVSIGGYSLEGVCWFLCTGAVKRYPKGFLEVIRECRDKVNATGNVCTNLVWMGNADHIKFLLRLGACFSKQTFDVRGGVFRRCYVLPILEVLNV